MPAINRVVTPTAPPTISPQTQAPSGPRPTPSTTHTSPSGPSPGVQSRIRHSQSQTQQASQTTSAQTVQQGSQLIAQTSPSSVQAQHSGASPLLKATQLGSQLASCGAKVHDASEAMSEFEIGGVKPLEHVGNTVGAITDGHIEAQVLEYATGISPESVKGAKDMLETGQSIMQACKTVNSLQQAYLSYGTADFSGHLGTASKEAFVTCGGKPTLELASKVGSFCSSMSLDSASELAKAATEFSKDDSVITGLSKTALTTVGTSVLGSTASNVISSSVPLLSFGVAAYDTATAVQKQVDWYNGKCSGTEALKSTITAIGSGTGATIAPVIGPLAATAVNLGIDGVGLAVDGVSSAYNYIKGWF